MGELQRHIENPIFFAKALQRGGGGGGGGGGATFFGTSKLFVPTATVLKLSFWQFHSI